MALISIICARAPPQPDFGDTDAQRACMTITAIITSRAMKTPLMARVHMTNPTAPQTAIAKQPKKLFKRQRVDRLLDLRLDDPKIDRDARTLAELKYSYRQNCVRRGYLSGLKTLPALYGRIRGPKFPLKQRNGKRMIQWRSLSPWMKVQIATLALSERGYMQFVVHLHDELRTKLDDTGRDHKDYLRDRITRCARSQFGDTRWFFFVMEDLTPDGLATRPHAHGSIEIRREPLPVKGEKFHLQYRRMSERKGIEHAELNYGIFLTEKVLRAASANLHKDRTGIVGGVDQSRNVWCSLPTRPFMNAGWVTYAFKNSKTFSATLGDRRLAFSTSLRTEGSKVWQLMRVGESAMSQWQ